MKRTLILALLLVAGQAFAATAHWTGRVEYGTSVTGRAIVSCEYNYAGNTFWRSFGTGACPSSVEVY